MKTWKMITIIGTVLVATAIATATAFAYMGGSGFYNPYGTRTGTNSYGSNGAYPGGMMGGGMTRGYGHGTGMMGGYGYGTTTPSVPSGQYGLGGCPDRGLNGYANSTNTGTPLTIDAAVRVAQQYVESLSNKDLAINEVEEYTQNFYILVKEKSTGIGAFEMLIDKYRGTIYPEMGPNMMWNTKYGMMSGGMMDWTTGAATGAMTVTAEQAATNAKQFMNANYPGTTVGGIDAFYGYYHVSVLSAGNTYGMLSVNGYSGQVWYHTWHGTFIQEIELG